MSERLIDRIPFAKIITVLAIVFGVSLGLCGVTIVFASSGIAKDNILASFGILALIAIAVSITGLLLTLLVFVTLSIFRAFGEKVSQPSIVPEAEDDTNTDKNP